MVWKKISLRWCVPRLCSLLGPFQGPKFKKEHRTAQKGNRNLGENLGGKNRNKPQRYPFPWPMSRFYFSGVSNSSYVCVSK